MDIGKRKSLMSSVTQRKVTKRIKISKSKRFVSSHFSTDDKANSCVNTSNRRSQSCSSSDNEDDSMNKSTKRKRQSHRSVSVSSGSSTSDTGRLSNSSGSSSHTSDSSNSESSSNASQLSNESSSSDGSSIETGRATKNRTPNTTSPSSNNCHSKAQSSSNVSQLSNESSSSDGSSIETGGARKNRTPKTTIPSSKNFHSKASRSASNESNICRGSRSILRRSKISMNKTRRTVTMSRNAGPNTCSDASNSSTSGSEDGSRTTARRSMIRLTKRARRFKSIYSINTDSSSNSLSSTTSKMVSYSSTKSSSSTDEPVHPQRRKRCANSHGIAPTFLTHYNHANKGHPKRKVIRKHPKPNKRIVVFGLSPLTGVLNLRLLFQQYGKVRYVKIIRDRLTTRSKGYAFIKFKHKSDAQTAVASSQNMNINGWIVRPTFSVHK